MPNAHDGLGHVISEVVDHVQEVAAVVKPRGCLFLMSTMILQIRETNTLTVVSKVLLVQDPTGALIRRVGYPYCSKAESIYLGSSQKLFPQRLIKLLK